MTTTKYLSESIKISINTAIGAGINNAELNVVLTTVFLLIMILRAVYRFIVDIKNDWFTHKDKNGNSNPDNGTKR